MLKVRCSHVESDYAQINLPGVADGIAFVERRNIRTSLDLNSGEEHRADRWFVYWLGSPDLKDDRVFRARSPHERTGFRTMLDAVQWIDQRLAETSTTAA